MVDYESVMAVSTGKNASGVDQANGLRERPFVLLLISSFLTFCGFWLLLPVVPLWASSAGATATEAGATTGAFMLATVLTQLGMPWLLTRFEHRLTLGLGAVLVGLPAFLFTVSTRLWLLYAVSAARGIGFGMVVVAGTALVAELLPAERRGRGSALYGVAVSLPNVVCLPAGVAGVQQFGYLPLFVLAGAAPLLGMLCVGGISAPSREGASAATASPADRPWTRLVVPGLVMLAGATASGVVVTFLPAALGKSAWTISLDLLAFAVAMVVFRWLAGAFGDKHGSPRLAAVGVGCAAAGMVALASAAALPTMVAAGLLGFVGTALLGAGFGAVQNDVLVLMFDRVGPGQYGVASTAWNMAFDSGTGLGAFAVGAVIDAADYSAAFLTTAAILVGVLPLALRILRPPRAPRGRN